MDRWSSPTTVYADGLGQLPTALAGRPAVVVADEALDRQLARLLAVVPATEVVRIAAGPATDGTADVVLQALARHPAAVPVALGGGSVMDVVRLAALAAADPAANGFRAPADGVTFLPTRAVNPAVCIPSTLGTAAEVSSVAVRASALGTAMIVSPGLRAAAAVLDPAVTSTLPRAAAAAGLVEPWARVCVPAVTGERLRLQDGLARGLGATLLALGDELVDAEPDGPWRWAAASASAQTHLGLLALGRAPAGHALWPLATEVVRATGLAKASALAALVPGWLRCLGSGVLSRCWGAAERVRLVLGAGSEESAVRLESWSHGLGLPTRLPADLEVATVVDRVVSPWQASGLFLPGVPREEIAAVLTASGAGAG